MNQKHISEDELVEFINRLGSGPIDRSLSIRQVKDIFDEMVKDGWVQSTKASQKAEAKQIKTEQRAAEAKAKHQKKLDKDRISVDKLEEIYGSAPYDEFTNPYELNMKDEILRERAEEAYKKFKKYKLTHEGPQQGSLFETEDREAWIKRYMRRTLDRIKRELKKIRRNE